MIYHSPPSEGAQFFCPFKVVLLRDVVPAKKGDVVIAEKIPNGRTYLVNNDGRVFCTAAIEGITFEQEKP